MARVRRDDWIRTGLELLADEGEQALTVHRLCEVMGKTTGSYYHHFVDHSRFRSHVIAAWSDEAMARCEVATSVDEGEWRDRRWTLYTSLTDLSVERAMRIWAWREEEAFQAVERLDQRRVAFLGEVYMSAGIHPDEALTLAWADYSAMIGALLVSAPDEVQRKQTQLIETRLESVL